MYVYFLAWLLGHWSLTRKQIFIDNWGRDSSQWVTACYGLILSIYVYLWFELNSVNLSSVSSKTSESICPFWRNSRKTRIRPFDLLWACLGLSKVGRATSYSDPRRFGGRNWQIEIFDIMMYDFHDMMLPPKPAVMNSEYEGNSCLEFFSGICFPFWTLFLNMMIQERLSEWPQLTWL